MMTFSEESRLLLSNWEAYQDVLKADGRLKREFQKALNSMEARLREETFWNTTWHFQRQGNEQVYIWHDNWLLKKESLVWIGVERAAPEGVFGDGSPASAYVWVSKSEPVVFIDALRKIFSVETDGHGEIASGKSGYVVQQVLPKCLPEDADRFEVAFLEPVTAFISHYAQWEEDITKAVREYVREGGPV